MYAALVVIVVLYVCVSVCVGLCVCVLSMCISFLCVGLTWCFTFVIRQESCKEVHVAVIVRTIVGINIDSTLQQPPIVVLKPPSDGATNKPLKTDTASNDVIKRQRVTYN